MDKHTASPFTSEIGEQIYKTARRTVDDYSMYPLISRGVLVGLSGGADSVALLYFLLELRRREGHFPILAVHINHMIRGDEANRDESFSRELAEELGVEFLSVRVDVPTIAESSSLSIETAARNARYSEFSKIISSRNGVSSIAVAHNATDNLETVIFNIMRGSGTNGASGITPVRDNIVRPLIEVDKESIVKMLDVAAITYVTDSTNFETEYTRNYIRHNVIKPLRGLFLSPEQSASRLSRNLRADEDFISSVADEFLKNNQNLRAKELMMLHDAVFARVIIKLAARHSSSVEELHILNIRRLLPHGDFSVSIPNGVRFVCDRGLCKILTDRKSVGSALHIPVKLGLTSLCDFDADIYLCDGKNEEISLNVYKNSIHADLSSAIIVGDLYMRTRLEGDTIFYGGHTHKLRKIFTDFKIPLTERENVLLLCDEKGIVWIPGLAVRGDVSTGEGTCLKVRLLLGKGNCSPEKPVRTISDYRINVSRNENNK